MCGYCLPRNDPWSGRKDQHLSQKHRFQHLLLKSLLVSLRRIVAAPQETDDVSVMSARVVNAASLSSGQSGVMRIARVEDANIKIDGRVDEAIWSEIPAFDRMTVTDPDTLEKPTHKTRTRILYTDKGFVCGW